MIKMECLVYRISSCRKKQKKHAINTLNVNYEYSETKTEKIK